MGITFLFTTGQWINETNKKVTKLTCPRKRINNQLLRWSFKIAYLKTDIDKGQHVLGLTRFNMEKSLIFAQYLAKLYASDRERVAFDVLLGKAMYLTYCLPW